MLEIIILSIVQGITEFLPISSSAHLILVSKYFNFNNANLTLYVSLHIGSLLAIITYFRKDIFNFIENKNMLLKIFISSIPTMIAGFLLIKYSLIDFLRDYKIIGWTTIIFGIFLYFSDLKKTTKIIKNDYNYKTAMYIGFFQVMSLIPGVSRSGITITGARIFNFGRIDSAKISFFMSIPILGVASIYNFKNLLIENNLVLSILNLYAVALSFIFSYLTIKFFLNFLKRFSLIYFVVYRILLGVLVLYYA